MLARARGVLVLHRVVVVAAIKLKALAALLLTSPHLYIGAAVLPEERADALYHNYNGGGITIDGPSILVRKNFAEQVSVSANYYVDSISSASIDAVTQASPYKEERTQTSAAVDYLHEKSTLSYSYTYSTENDYDAETNYFGISQEMFGGLSTVSLSYTQGDNTVSKTGDDSFSDVASFKNYRASLAQVLTKKTILSLTYDLITDEGFLNNPYRQVRYLDSSAARGYSFQDEIYPRTRTSNAASFNLRYHLPYRAAAFIGYRFFTDSWGINADTIEIGYTHPVEENWMLETSVRYYKQNQADFYSDLFPFEDAQNFLARDKELSNFSDYSFNIGLSYALNNARLSFFEKASANLYFSHIIFNYDNFRDIRETSFAVGSEPEYSFSANVIRMYLSFWF